MTRPTYADYLHEGDCYNTFAEFLGINAPTFRWDTHKRGWIMRRFDHMNGTVEGECKPTKKEAKASYKAALARHRAELKSSR